LKNIKVLDVSLFSNLFCKFIEKNIISKLVFKIILIKFVKINYVQINLSNSILFAFFNLLDIFSGVIWSNGSKFWYENGKLYKDGDKPAVTHPNGTKWWYKNGKLIKRFISSQKLWKK